MNYIDPFFGYFGAEDDPIDSVYPKPDVPKPIAIPTPEEEQARLWALVVQSAKN